MLTHLRYSFRMLSMVWVLARHDVFALLEGTTIALPLQWLGRLVCKHQDEALAGNSLALALQKLGPVYIKLGQALSTRADLIGEAAARDLSLLQDKLPPFPCNQAIAIIETELGQPLSSLYLEFSPKAVAAASIAQVHKAITVDGQKVAVKVVRPDVRKAFARDLGFLHWSAQNIERRIKPARRLRLPEVVETLERSIELEMDMRYEAAAASELADNMRTQPGFRVPTIDWMRTGQRVLTLEWIEGIPLYDTAAVLAAGHDPALIVANAANAFFNQVYRDGFFHADMHPGNLFIDPAGNIVAVDFGIMGRLDHRTRLYLARMLQGFLQRDYRLVAQIHFDADYVPADQNLEEFTQACRSIAEPIMGKPLNEISAARLMAQLFAVAETFQMRTQPHLLLLQKSMMLSEGIGRTLYPSTNMWMLAEPLIRDWVTEQLSPPAQIKRRLQEASHFTQRLPALMNKAERVLQQLDGGLRIHPDTLKQFQRSRRMSQDILFLILLFATVWAGLLLL